MMNLGKHFSEFVPSVPSASFQLGFDRWLPFQSISVAPLSDLVFVYNLDNMLHLPEFLLLESIAFSTYL